MGTRNEQARALGFYTSSCNSSLLSILFVSFSSSSDIAKWSRALLDVCMDFVLRNLRLLLSTFSKVQSASKMAAKSYREVVLCLN